MFARRFLTRNLKPIIFTGTAIAFVSANTFYAEQKRITTTAEIARQQYKEKTHLTVKDVNKQFKRSEVSLHNSKDTGIWVSFEGGVYDVTDFVNIHPGGEKILLAAGKDIDPFWKIFSIHNSKETRELLESYRIGDLVPLEDDDSPKQDLTGLEELFCNEPNRDPSLQILAERPFNAAAALESLNEFITPNEKFYVRNHLPVPKIDPEAFRLEIDGTPNTISLSIEDLKKLPKFSVMATMQCAGNRRKEMHEVRPVKGLLWDAGAISNTIWTGVRLIDVLKLAGYEATFDQQEFPNNVRHVHFDGAEGYGASVPAEKVFNPRGDVIIAYEMNGKPIPADHGFPLRAVIPGHVAARSVKWLSKITLDEDESNSHWQRKDYKGFNPSRDLSNSDYEKSESIQELPVQSAIISPQDGQNVELVDGKLNISGYAISGGGRAIYRVDVSADGGKTWNDATLIKPEQPSGRTWAWTKWEAQIPVSGKNVEIVCKAVDESYNTQPDSFEGIYNARGVLASAWARVKVKIGNK